MTSVAIAAAGERGAIIIGLAQAQRDIQSAIDNLRADNSEALGNMCQAVDLLMQSYKAAMELLLPVEVVIPERRWNIDVDTRTVSL